VGTCNRTRPRAIPDKKAHGKSRPERLPEPRTGSESARRVSSRLRGTQWARRCCAAARGQHEHRFGCHQALSLSNLSIGVPSRGAVIE
jgi:hypothetical protein